MPDIWFLRHGEAEDKENAPDFERELTEKGERQSRVAGQGLARLGLEFATVFTSPRVRARDTARLACEALGCEPIVHEPLSEGFDGGDARELLHGVGGDGAILVVGHEPDFSDVISELTGARVDMKKGGVAGVRHEGGSGELIVLLRPRDLKVLAS